MVCPFSPRLSMFSSEELFVPRPTTALPGRCSELPVDQADPLFYPERGQNGKAAKALCSESCVRAECPAFALDNREQFRVPPPPKRPRSTLLHCAPDLPAEDFGVDPGTGRLS